MRRATLPRGPAGSRTGRRSSTKRIRAGAVIALMAAWLGPGCRQSETKSEQAPAAETAESDHFTKLPDQITWLDPPSEAGFLPRGVKLALLEGGSPLDKGPFTCRLKFPPGSRLMPHTHSVIDRITVISGTLHQGMGRVFDQRDPGTVPAGGFVYQAPNVAHFVWFDEETVLQFNGTGPFGLTYVDPADDPRNQR